MAEWKQVPGFPEYVACSDGRVAHLVGHEGAHGYLQVELPGKLLGRGHGYGTRPSGRHKSRVYVHHIIAVTFLGEPPNGKTQPNHLDGNKLNNSVSNLQWVNQSENVKHGWTLRKNRSYKKMSPSELRTILQLRRDGQSYAKIAGITGRHATAIAYRVRQAEVSCG